MILLRSKLLDSDMSPLGFDAQQMFRFLSVRFEGTNLRIQQQSLDWLQLLSSLTISVNISLLVNIFEEGVTTGKLDDLGDLPGANPPPLASSSMIQLINSSDVQISRKTAPCHPYPTEVFQRTIKYL